MSVKLRPHEDHLVVQRHIANSVTPGGIYLPDGAKDKPQRGTVVAVGPGKPEWRLQWEKSLTWTEQGRFRSDFFPEVGSDVLFTKYAGNDFTVDGVEYTTLKFSDVIATIGAATDESSPAESPEALHL